MAEVKSVQKGNKYEVRKKEKVKKEKAPKLSTYKKLRQSREVAQGKRSYEDLWGFIIGFIVFLSIVFVLFGGINQRKFIETTHRLGNTIAEFVAGFFEPFNVNVTDDGVYLEVEQTEENVEEITNGE